jgi:hypothetical protein
MARNRQAAAIADIVAAAGMHVYEGVKSLPLRVQGELAHLDQQLLHASRVAAHQSIDAMKQRIENPRRAMYTEPDLIPVEALSYVVPEWQDVVERYNSAVSTVTSPSFVFDM